MKLKATLLILLMASAAFSEDKKEEVVQSGVPATLETTAGKKARVYLQSLENDKLTFQAPRSSKNIAAPVDKIKSLEFSMSKEDFDFFRAEQIISDEQIAEISKREDLGKAEKLAEIYQTVLANIKHAFLSGDYAGTIKALEPMMKAYGPFMSIDNNLVDYYAMLMKCYLRQEDFSNTRKCAQILQQSADSNLVLQANADLALVAIAGDDLETARSLVNEINSEPAKLYLQAAILRAEDEPRQAIQKLTDLIEKYPNDMMWMPSTELMAAYLYVDMLGTNSVITTNSAIFTARATKNIYDGIAPESADGKKLWISLGGEEIEKQAEAEKAARKKAREEAKAKLAAQRKARAEERRKKKEAEAAAAAAGTNLTATVESTNAVETAGTVETGESE